MGIGHKDTIDIPVCKEMQGVYRSAVICPHGQHTKPIEMVNELTDRFSVAAQALRHFHIGSCGLPHLQDNLNALDVVDGLCPHCIAVISLCRHSCIRAENLPSKRKFHCSSKKIVQ